MASVARNVFSWATRQTRASAFGVVKPTPTIHGLPGSGMTGAHAHRSTSTTTRVAAENSTGEGAPKVVILGGGFGGLYTAVRLCSLFWPRGKQPQVTLVDKSERSVFKPLMYELLNDTASESEVTPSFTQLLAPYPVRFLQSKVVSATPEELLRDGGSASGGVVKLECGQELEYDYLVIALGAQPDSRGVPGVEDLTVPFNDLDDALKVRDSLAAIEAAAEQSSSSGEPRHVMVVGAGYSGVELAAVVAERLANKGLSGRVKVSIVTPGQHVLEGSPAGQRQAAEEVLATLGIEITTTTRVTSVQRSGAADALPTAVLVNLDDKKVTMADMREGAASVADTAASVAEGVAAAASAAAAALRNPETAGSVVSEAQSAFSDATTSAGDAATESSSQEASEKPSGRRQVAADLVLWTAGMAPVTKAARKGFPFPTNNKGSVMTDAALRVQSHSRVFALGDVCVADKSFVQDDSSKPAAAASSSGGTVQYFPATAQVAFQQADYVAWNVWAAMNSRPLLPFRYQHLGNVMSLGTFNAAVDVPISLPSQLSSAIQATPVAGLLNTLGVKLSDSGEPGGDSGVTLEGPLAALMRRAVYLYRQPTGEQRINVATEWLAQGAQIANSTLSYLQSRSGSGKA